MVDFIGIGAQKCGTSWVYACLYEHPQVCAPVKEIHFFSRDRFSKGKEWYESHFVGCVAGKKSGEYSTSYLYAPEAPERIHRYYPNVKLIAILRDPIARAYSQYGNAIKAGEIKEGVAFEEYVGTERSALEQGRYAEQLDRYLKFFDASQLLVLAYEDSKTDPALFIRTIYTFLGVDPNFVPSMLHSEINVARIPKNIALEKTMHRCAEYLRHHGLDRLVHSIRKLGIPDLVRTFNTKKVQRNKKVFERAQYVSYFSDDVKKLSTMLNRDFVTLWNMHM